MPDRIDEQILNGNPSQVSLMSLPFTKMKSVHALEEEFKTRIAENIAEREREDQKKYVIT